MSRAAVVGGGIAGMVAAWDLSAVGYDVDLYEAAERLGGAIGTHRLAGVEFDAGAESFATRSRAVPELIEELGLQQEVIVPNSAGAWLQLPDMASPLPATGLLGIPADPQAEDVVAILGEQAAGRAAADLHAPVDRWTEAARLGERPSVGEVVRDRMGEAVLQRLVVPIVSGVYSADADGLDLETAAPGLFAAMLHEGSLARAVVAQKAKAPAGAAVNSLAGGLHTLIGALERQLRERGVRIHLQAEVRHLGQLGVAGIPEGKRGTAPDGSAADGGRSADSGAGRLSGSGLEGGDGSAARPEHVVLAVDGPAAVGLARTAVPGLPDLPAQEGRGVALVSMLLHAPELDARPRGTGMLVAPSARQVQAKAMTHVSSKWEWVSARLRAELCQGHHLVRLSYGRVTDDPASGALGYASSDELLRQAAAADVATLFGLPVGAGQILDADVVRWNKALPQTSSGHRARIEELRESLALRNTEDQQGGRRRTSLHMTGSWFAGTGLARVIPDARRTVRGIVEDWEAPRDGARQELPEGRGATREGPSEARR